MAMAVRVKGLATAASVVSRVVHQNDCVDTNMMRVLNMCKRSESSVCRCSYTIKPLVLPMLVINRIVIRTELRQDLSIFGNARSFGLTTACSAGNQSFEK